jgi:hypothetical protein
MIQFYNTILYLPFGAWSACPEDTLPGDFLSTTLGVLDNFRRTLHPSELEGCRQRIHDTGSNEYSLILFRTQLFGAPRFRKTNWANLTFT